MEEPRQESPAFTVKKKVDESWKNSVEKEKSVLSPASDASQAQPQEAPPREALKSDPNFLYFVSGLGMQALAALGEIPDESGIAMAPDLDQAKHLIDILDMLARKTKGNQSAEEENAFRELLRELRLKFVQKSRGV